MKPWEGVRAQLCCIPSEGQPSESAREPAGQDSQSRGHTEHGDEEEFFDPEEEIPPGGAALDAELTLEACDELEFTAGVPVLIPQTMQVFLRQ